MSDYVVVDEQQVYKLPEDMDMKKAALTGNRFLSAFTVSICAALNLEIR